MCVYIYIYTHINTLYIYIYIYIYRNFDYFIWIILSIRSEEVLLFLVFLIYIKTHNRMTVFCFFLKKYIYIYIYIYIYANFIKHNRHFMSTYFLLDPFEFPYYFYRIRGELIYVLSIVVCIPSTFCPTLGHHQGKIYYKSDVTFVLAYYYCVRASLPLKIMAFAFKWNSIISASS